MWTRRQALELNSTRVTDCTYRGSKSNPLVPLDSNNEDVMTTPNTVEKDGFHAALLTDCKVPSFAIWEKRGEGLEIWFGLRVLDQFPARSAPS